MIEWGCLIVFAGFISDWLAVFLGWIKIRPYTKVLALFILIIWTLSAFDLNPGRLGLFLILALTFGLLGDFLLLFPRKFFKWGLGAFLLGHLTYLTLFYVLIRLGRVAGLIARTPIWAWFGAGGIVVIALIVFNRVIIQDMREPRPWWLFQVALYLYAVCLSAMMVAGFLAADLFKFGGMGVWSLALGGTLFFISDFILAYDRFVRPFKKAHILIMITYHLAQFSLAVGFITLIALF